MASPRAVYRDPGMRALPGNRERRSAARRAAVLVAGALALAGCNKVGPPPSQIGDVAERYLQAAGAQDWAAVCDTRTRLERYQVGLRAGSCPRGFEEIIGKAGAARLRDARLGEIRVEGELAGVDVLGPDGERITILGAIIDEGRWLLQNLPEGETP